MPTESIDIRQAKARLSRLVERAEAGEEIKVSRAGQPVARIVPLLGPRTPRKPGLLKGKIRIGRDFDLPLHEDVLAAFGGGSPGE